MKKTFNCLLPSLILIAGCSVPSTLRVETAGLPTIGTISNVSLEVLTDSPEYDGAMFIAGSEVRSISWDSVKFTDEEPKSGEKKRTRFLETGRITIIYKDGAERGHGVREGTLLIQTVDGDWILTGI